MTKEELLKKIDFEKSWLYDCGIFGSDVDIAFNAIKNSVIEALEQEPKTEHYEKHIDHTDCIWYGSDSGCPVTCSQYRDGWNDAMDYIFKNGKGYRPYRRNG